MGTLATVSLPNWFKEGLAVMTSDGGGAEGVSEAAAREAIRHGDRIAINDSGSIFHLTALEFEKAPNIPQNAMRVQMAYRQASLFVAYLRDTDAAAFTRMMRDIEADRPFKDAVTAAYGADVSILWSRFIASCRAFGELSRRMRDDAQRKTNRRKRHTVGSSFSESWLATNAQAQGRSTQ